MPVSLAEAKLNAQNDYDPMVIDEFRNNARMAIHACRRCTLEQRRHGSGSGDRGPPGKDSWRGSAPGKSA